MAPTHGTCRTGSLQWYPRRFSRLTTGRPLLKVHNRAQSAIHSALTIRVVLNIREVASRGLDDFSLDLHLPNTDSHACRSPIVFAKNRAVLDSIGEQMNDMCGRKEKHDSGASMERVE